MSPRGRALQESLKAHAQSPKRRGIIRQLRVQFVTQVASRDGQSCSCGEWVMEMRLLDPGRSRPGCLRPLW